jgi:hypothetical protein
MHVAQIWQIQVTTLAFPAGIKPDNPTLMLFERSIFIF